MNLVALILITVSAVMHAGWNLLGKHEHPDAAFFLVATFFGSVMMVPVVMFWFPFLPGVSLYAWFLTALGGLFQALYYVTLAFAYRHGEMSVAYPICRSFPLVLVVLASLALGKGAEISGLCLAGVAAIVVGSIILPMARFRDVRLKSYANLSSMMALVVACTTAGYSVVDDVALSILVPALEGDLQFCSISLLYLFFQNGFAILFLALMTLPTEKGRTRVREIRRHRLRNTVIAGIGVTATYGLVLMAMTVAENVTYVVAFRQMSIPLGTVLGVLVLKEQRAMPKLVGISVISLGLVCVALG
ncbi:MAG: multidrug DMT transporter permease [Desulfobacteraceae bacterium]|nr:multidrug DMT transporter permease [Desulfobacteraceae bacterium]